MIGAISLLVIANFSWYSPSQTQAAGTTNMFLFWDPANALPNCWSVYSAGNGYFPYGDSAAAFNTQTNVAGRPYTPTASTINTSLASLSADNVGNQPVSAYIHTHPSSPVVTFGADTSSDPANPDIAAFRSYQLIEYNVNFLTESGGTNVGCNGTGVATTIPRYAIVLFGSSTIPSGFTRVSAQDGRLIKISASVTNGGDDNESNTVSMSGLAAGSGTDNRVPQAAVVASVITHTHAPPATLTCTTGCVTSSTACAPPSTFSITGGTGSTNTFTCTTTGDIPPYVQPIMGQATADYPTIAINLVSIFNGDPGTGWVVLSNSGGQYYHQFIRPNATYNAASQGSATRSIGLLGVTGTDIGGSGGNAKNTTGSGTAQQGHTHTVTVTSNTLSTMVPQMSVTIAQKVSFTMNAYRWFVDASGNSGSPDFNTTNVSDPWPVGALNLAQDTQLPAIPTQYLPPDVIVKTSLRLRAQILVSGQALVANSTTFKLQYQVTGSDDCLAGTWTDVAPNGTSAGPTSQWTYGSNTLADSTRLTTSALTPASSVLQYFSRSIGGAITGQTVGTGQSMEYDWLVQNNNANTGTEYHIRIVEGNGTPLSLYQNTTTSKAECPDVITKPGVDQELRHGDFFLPDPNSNVSNDPDQGYAWVD